MLAQIKHFLATAHFGGGSNGRRAVKKHFGGLSRQRIGARTDGSVCTNYFGDFKIYCQIEKKIRKHLVTGSNSKRSAGTGVGS